MVQMQNRLIFSNGFFDVKTKINKFLEGLSNEIPCLTENDLFDLRLMYHELISNAILHGNKQDSTKKVELVVEVSECDIISSVKDDGNGFDYINILKQAIETEDYFSEHGRGLRLVYAIADQISFNDIGNEVIIRKMLK